MFISVLIAKSKTKYNYGKQYRIKSLEKHSIPLPHTPNGEIAFEAMEAFIKELQAERLEELQAYLKVTGLEDTKLTPEEAHALNIFSAHFANRGGGGAIVLPLVT